MKHAYLIMAHHRLDLLNELIIALDDEDNDLFIHIDKKCKEHYEFVTKKSKIYFIERMDVKWAGYTQVQCEYNLLKKAMKTNTYDYYHLITGATYPLKDNKTIKNFFANHQGKEFIGFDPDGYSSYCRVKNHFPFSEIGKPTSVYKKALVLYRNFCVKLQDIFKIDYFKKFNLVYKKGLAYFSITHEFALYLLNNEKIVQKMLKKSISGDEVFVQTLAYNSIFRNKIFDLHDEYRGCMVCAAWPKFTGVERTGNCFILNDLELLLNNHYLFGYKFEGPDGLSLIRAIKMRNSHDI